MMILTLNALDDARGDFWYTQRLIISRYQAYTTNHYHIVHFGQLAATPVNLKARQVDTSFSLTDHFKVLP